MFNIIRWRVLPVLLTLTLCISLCVPFASAAGIGYTYGLDIDSVSGWENSIRNPIADFVEAVAKDKGIPAVGASVFWFMVDGAHDVQPYELGEVTDKQLSAICARFNSYFNTPLDENPKIFTWLYEEFWTRPQSNALALALGLGTPLNFVLKKHPSSGLWRIFEETNGLWVVNSAGQYFCYDESTSGDTWIHVTEATKLLLSSKVAMETGPDLKFKYDALRLNGESVGLGTLQGRNYVQYKAIRKGDLVRADYRGYPYISPADDSYWLIYDDDRGQDTDVKDENGAPVEGLPDENTTNINLGDMTVNLPDGILAYIENLTYDEGEKTYYIDAIYKDVTNNYTTNYYLKWEYHINYTSITYIGQTAEYDKYYEVYYELPDGRSSADLTKEELEQLNLSIDVIPYERASDDTSLRSLYHFDGDTRDASYWNYCTDFAWKTGASLTYMDSGAFNGALYLDEKEHEFTITLPSDITAADFTLQFRYYQGYTAAAVNDSYISFGDTVVMRMNGTHLMKQTSTKMAEMPIGTWNEIAFMRKGSTHYWYLNGVCLASGTGFNGTTFEDTITFHFGSEQQTFKYLDELRFLDYALVKGGANYTPTAVPHDTNLTLVLPEGSTVVADEYWSITSSKKNLLGMTRDDFASGKLPDWYVKDAEDADENGFLYPRWMSFDASYGSVYTDGVLGAHDGFLRLQTVKNYNGAPAYTSANGMRAALMTKMADSTGDIPWQNGWPDEGYITLSIALTDGNVYSVPYNLDEDWERVSTFSWGKMGFLYEDDCWWIVVHPTYNTAIDILYMELVVGNSTDLSAEWVESVTVIPNENINTPTLAVRTDIAITDYQIGGVRPSVPAKGQVWALVESGRISSIQIYNGQAWESVDGRIWTGQRWIPYSSYNVLTLQDMYDITDATPNYEYIYTEQGFWSWWQKSWNEFTAKLFNALGGGSSSDPSKLPTDGTEAPENNGQKFKHLIIVLRDGFWSICVGLADAAYGGLENFANSVSTVGDFFTSYGDGENSIWLLPLEEGASVWD